MKSLLFAYRRWVGDELLDFMQKHYVIAADAYTNGIMVCPMGPLPPEWAPSAMAWAARFSPETFVDFIGRVFQEICWRRQLVVKGFEGDDTKTTVVRFVEERHWLALVSGPSSKTWLYRPIERVQSSVDTVINSVSARTHASVYAVSGDEEALFEVSLTSARVKGKQIARSDDDLEDEDY